jgi:hypothetical protein
MLKSHMDGKRRTLITIESRRLTVFRPRHRRLEIWCDRCGKELLMITPETAAALEGVSVRAIYRLIESGEVHFIDTCDRTLLICSGSFESFRSPDGI